MTRIVSMWCAILLATQVLAAGSARAEREAYHLHFTEPWADGDSSTVTQEAGIAYANYDLGTGVIEVFAEAIEYGFAWSSVWLACPSFTYDDFDWINTFKLQFRFTGVMDTLGNNANNYFSIRAELFDYDHSLDNPVASFISVSKQAHKCSSEEPIIEDSRIFIFKHLLEQGRTYRVGLSRCVSRPRSGTHRGRRRSG